MDPYIGKLLDDRYEILDVLGTGGMAVVYRAYCHRLNRHVAVKILKSELAADQDLRRRFHDESQAVAMLSHPNIVAVYDVSQVDGREFIVMELIDGITLKQYMHKRGGCLNWREALHFITQILQGLKHAHSRGIIHRDIKPQNVMVLRDGSVKVMDFGIARSTTSQVTMTQETIGSVHYISPEQARGSHIDARSDLYSAGVVLYEMLTGRLPFEGDNPVSVAIQHIKSIPVAPRELNPEVPLGMEQITLKAMAPVPDRRYSSAEEMLQDLEAFRKNPEIDFGYTAPGVLDPEADEPTMVRRGGSFLDEEADPDATVRSTPARRATARFEREEDTSRRSSRSGGRTYDDGYDGDGYDDDYDDYADEKRRNKRFIAITGGIAGGLIILFIILYFTVFRSLFATTAAYHVPDLRGYTVEQAEELIAADPDLQGHFTVTVGETVASEEEVGTIIDQSPDSTQTVRTETTEIVVTLSGGPAEEEPTEFTLENYGTGTRDYREVVNELTELGLVVTSEGEYSDDISEYMVIRTSPAAGTTVKEGDSIVVYYSLGEEITEHNMTQLIGLTEADARNAISSLGLLLDPNIGYEYSDDQPEGRVCYQSIPYNTPVQEGQTVTITVSLGPEPEEEDPETSTGGETTTEAQFRITVTLPEGRTEDTILELTINGETSEETISPEDGNTFTTIYTGTIYSYTAMLTYPSTSETVECDVRLEGPLS